MVRWGFQQSDRTGFLTNGGIDKSQSNGLGRARGLRGSDSGGYNRTLRDTALQQGLRAAYRTVIEEPLPDRLMSLLQQLDGDGPTR